jgi:hypothetical protein
MPLRGGDFVSIFSELVDQRQGQVPGNEGPAYSEASNHMTLMKERHTLGQLDMAWNTILYNQQYSATYAC